MKLYFAALHCGWKEIWDFEIPQRILLSYHYHTDMQRTLDYCKERDICKHVELIIDSGAFSAWSLGKYISIRNYADCVKKIRDNYNFKTFYVVNLDVIPGKKGQKITQEQSKESMLKGWENYQFLKKEGIESIHVYHQGEDENFLLNTIIKECKYIGVSPSNDASFKQKMIWCERIFHLLPEEIKTHGFAVTSERLIKKFPWYSVDSASWSISAGMGRISSSFGTLYYSTKGAGKGWYSDNPVLKDISEDMLFNEITGYGVKLNKETWQNDLKANHQLRRLVNYCYFKKIGEDELNRIDKPKKFIDPQLQFL